MLRLMRVMVLVCVCGWFVCVFDNGVGGDVVGGVVCVGDIGSIDVRVSVGCW